MIKGSIHQEHNSPVCAPNNQASEYMKQKLINWNKKKEKKVSVYSNSFIIRDWNTLLSLTMTYNKSIKQTDKNQFLKISKNRENLNNELMN